MSKDHLQKITELGEWQTAYETIAELKAENERLKEALVELVSINNINADFTGRNFAWAELQLANEVLRESKS